MSADSSRTREAPPRWLIAALAAVIACAAVARMARDPWIAHQAPPYARLLEGQLVMRDTADYHSIVPFIAGAEPLTRSWIGTEHARSWVPIYVAGTLFYWTRSLFWSLAVVDLISLWLGAVCMYPLARRLGLPTFGAAAAALLTAASPVFASILWMNQIHGANTASLVWGTYAALLVLDRDSVGLRALGARALALGATLFVVGLLYNYVWVIVPCLAALVAMESGARPRRGVVLVGGALLYAALVAAERQALARAGWPIFPQAGDPDQRLLAMLRSVTWREDLTAVLGGMHPRRMASVFHPLPLAVGAAGIVLGPRRLRAVGVAGSLLAAFQGSLATVPWVVSNNYPFVYAGIGVALALVRRAMPGPRAAGTAMACAAGVFLAAAANVDVVGDYALVRAAWLWRGTPF